MAIEWRVRVYDPSGSSLVTLDGTRPISEIPSIQVGGDGDCKEASLDALLASLTITDRSILEIQVNIDGAGWLSRFRGIVTQPGAKRSPDPNTVKAVGLKHRLYEKVIEEPVIAGGDVALMVRSILANAFYRPAGTLYDVSLIPSLNLTAGERFPNRETVGDFLDAMAALAGAFTVLSGTYVHDGNVYTAGQEVPAVSWGVNGEGKIFFKRPNRAFSHPLTEGSNNVSVTWRSSEAETIVSRAIFEIPPLNATIKSGAWRDPLKAEAVPLVAPAFYVGASHIDHGVYDATEIIPWPGGDVPTLETSSTSQIASNWLNPTFAIDSSETSYALDNLDADPISYEAFFNSVPTLHGVALIYRSNVELELYIRNQLRNQANFIMGHSITRVTLEATEGIDKNIKILLPPDIRYAPVSAPGTNWNSVGILGLASEGREVRLLQIKGLVLDTATLQQMAGSYWKLPREDVGSLHKANDILLVKPLISLTLATGGPALTKRAALYTFSITKARGYETTVELEQPYEAELSAADGIQKRRLRQSASLLRRFGKQ